ncbi:MAG: type II toxin-antitoxin system prevent-host-death family antitoxin [Burkholderiales bacterium]|nr:type II toxin-antitoxin system prevent-host-death family antitoxin [Burkholderiales bacterium]
MAAHTEACRVRLARLAFEHLPAEAVSALDNYQEAPAEAPLHEALAIVAGEAPAGLRWRFRAPGRDGDELKLVIPSDQSYNVTMKQIPAAKFKEQCLALIDSVDGDGIVITKRGKPVARLIPLGADSATLIGSLKGKVSIKGDILSTGARWNAER